MTDREQRIRERAYQLWESEGRRDGDHEAHWLRASQESEDDASVEKVNEEASRRFDQGEKQPLEASIAQGTSVLGSPD
jgi:hypothetical protein